MAPTEHLAWLADNIRWYEKLQVAHLTRDVPACPGWSVEDVINHLSFGLALAYPVAMSKPPATDSALVFDDVAWPDKDPNGQQALDTFSTNMSECMRRFTQVDPQAACWTYEGPGRAGFWFRRAAVETTLHRMDVAEALEEDRRHLADARSADAITETLSFALPLAGGLTQVPDGELVVTSSCLESPLSVGTGLRVANLTGEPHDVLNALWGRHRDRVSVSGDQRIATEWLSAIETAFAGR